MDSKKIDPRQRWLLGSVMVLSLVLAMTALQRQFDDGDHRRARELLAAHAPDARWWVGRELVERAGGGAPDCKTEITSGFAGLVQLTCRAGEGPPYVFSADLVRQVLTPLDDHTRELMKAAAAKNAAPPDAGAAGAAEAG